MTAMFWPFAAIVIACLAWDGWVRQLRTRQAIQESRIQALEQGLQDLASTGKVLADHLRRIVALERNQASERME